MAQYTNGQLAQLNGEYSYKVYIGTGTAKLQMRDGNETWTDVPDTSVSASAGKTLKFAGEVKAVLTGDAALYLNEIA